MAATAMGSIGGGRLTKLLVVLQIFITINVEYIVGDPDPDPADIHVNVHLDINVGNAKTGPNGPTTSGPNVLPEPGTHPTTGSGTTIESSNGRHLDVLSTQELWLHILLQFDRPYGDRSNNRGEGNYVYQLDNEKDLTDRSSTPIIIPAIDAFTTDAERFENLLNYQKGRDVVPPIFDPGVKKSVGELHAVYKEHPGAKGMLKVAVNAKDHVNEYIHVVALNHAIAYDKEMFGFSLPALYDVIPDLFSPTPTTAPEGCYTPGYECCQLDDYPHDLTLDEWKLSYWREDAGFNDFHGSWHYYNPFGSGAKENGNVPLIQGELFYYFHNQLVARYELERFSNGMDPVEPLDNWSSSYKIPLNYKPPVLTGGPLSLQRCANDDVSTWRFDKLLTTYRNNLETAISNSILVQTNNFSVNIQNDDGIKYVGCALGSENCGDIDTTLYGGPPNMTFGIHGCGHVIIGNTSCARGPVENPPQNVMDSDWTAVRDPLFYRWHKFMDDIFQLHKKTLQEYNLIKLGLDDVSIGSVAVNSIEEEGQLHTFNSVINMTQWFNENTSICILQKTSDHYPFTYNITVNYNGGGEKQVNVRIFLAPKDPTLSYEELRTRWALMDRFHFTLKMGSNAIERESCKSSITAPRPTSLKKLISIYSDEEKFIDDKSKPKKKCQCGLPEHLLIPRGNETGVPYQLFVYITARNDEETPPSGCPTHECSELCSKEYTDCLHSDGEVMGFPFDRPLTSLTGPPFINITSIEDLDKKLPNAMLYDIKIFYENVQNNTRQCNN